MTFALWRMKSAKARRITRYVVEKVLVQGDERSFSYCTLVLYLHSAYEFRRRCQSVHYQLWYLTTLWSSTSTPNHRPSMFGPTRGRNSSMNTPSRCALRGRDIQRNLRSKRGTLEERVTKNHNARVYAVEQCILVEVSLW